MIANEPRRISLAQLPTPLVRLKRLETHVGGLPLWMKRDDLTGLELSGNKIRKLEYIAAEAMDGGCDTLVTEGTCQSNHCRATAAVCARLGLGCVLLFRPRPPDAVRGNHLLDVLFGADIRAFSREEFSANREQIVQATLSELREAGRRPRFVPMGASEPLGCWGYIRAMLELRDQVGHQAMPACDIVMPISSCGTHAGAVLGAAMAGSKPVDLRIWAVPVSDDVAHHTHQVRELCRQTIEQYDLDLNVSDLPLRFLDGYIGEGYARPYPAALDALRLLARLESILLDPVYTAKACHGMLDTIRRVQADRSTVEDAPARAIPAKPAFGERPVVFLHTGGAWSDFAWPEMLLGA
jgi:D-cysteine desulfhydrase